MFHRSVAASGVSARARSLTGTWVSFLALVLLNCVWTSAGSAQGDALSARLQTRLPQFTVRGATLGHAMTRLHLAGVPVCYEQLNVRNVQTRSVVRPAVDLDLSGVTVSEALDRVVQENSGYRWETDTTHGLITVLPPDAYSERVRISVSAQKVGLLDLLWGPELNLAQYGIYSLHDGPRVPNPPVDISVANASLKDVLNTLVAQAPGWAWQLVGVEDARSLTLTYWGQD